MESGALHSLFLKHCFFYRVFCVCVLFCCKIASNAASRAPLRARLRFYTPLRFYMFLDQRFAFLHVSRCLCCAPLRFYMLPDKRPAFLENKLAFLDVSRLSAENAQHTSRNATEKSRNIYKENTQPLTRNILHSEHSTNKSSLACTQDLILCRMF